MATIHTTLTANAAQLLAVFNQASTVVQNFIIQSTNANNSALNGTKGLITSSIALWASYKAAVEPLVNLFQTFAEQEKLVLSLRAVEGSAEGASARLEVLRELAMKPGLSFDSVVAGEVRLRATGMAAEETTKTLAEFGNALALVGGGGEELKGVVLALGQISAKGKVQAEEINQIAERLPQIRVAMRDAFGTADTEVLQKMGLDAMQFIRGVTVALGALPRATGGAADSVMKLDDSWTSLKASLGSVIAIPAVPVMRSLARYLTEVRKITDGEKSNMGPISKALIPQAAILGYLKRNRELSAGVTKEEKERLRLAKANLETFAEEVRLKNSLKRPVAADPEKLLRASQDIVKMGQEIEQWRFDMLPDEQQLKQLKANLRDAFSGVRLSTNIDRILSGKGFLGIQTDKQLQSAAEAAGARGDLKEQERLLKILQEVMQAKKRIGEIEKEEAERRKARKSAAKDYEFEMQLLREQVAGNDELVAELERQEAIEKEKHRIMTMQGRTAAEALAMARERVELEERAAKAAEEKERVENEKISRANFAADVMAMRLELDGRKELAEALRTEMRLRAEAPDLAKSLGVEEQEALRLLQERETLQRELQRREEDARRGGRAEERRRGIRRSDSGINAGDGRRIDAGNGRRPDAGAGREIGLRNHELDRRTQERMRDKGAASGVDQMIKVLEKSAGLEERMLKIWEGIGVV